MRSLAFSGSNRPLWKLSSFYLTMSLRSALKATTATGSSSQRSNNNNNINKSSRQVRFTSSSPDSNSDVRGSFESSEEQDVEVKLTVVLYIY